MPPPNSNLKLEAHEKEILKRWVEQGAEWKPHWAFSPPIEAKIPAIKHPNWAGNPIDHFILQKLESKNLAPSHPARPEKILRRLSFDLTGLPPSMENIEAFLENPSEAVYQDFIDKYLNSNAYAERMTSEWLDLARYADTHGYQDDLERTMWPWRDWVIHTFRQNMPYDQFVTWQLAGDLLPNATKEQIIATAFNRNHKITQEGGVISEEYRAEYVTDRTNTFGTAFLGLTVECAKCHDHKYDPISQKEYFQLFGYFNNIAEKGLIENYGEIPEPYIKLTKVEIEESLTFINNVDTLEEIPLLVMKELEEARETHILERGLYDKPTVSVQPAVLSLGVSPEPSMENKATENRLDLAKWLFEEKHSLTARVVVNRIWKQLFGRGLVASSYDFGNQGTLPSHPELLDHLALKLQKDHWDLHQLIRYIVSSSTYRQSSKISPQLLEIDPNNELLARAPRSRLTAEMLRDHALSISGLLVKEIGEPSVKPYQPAGLWNETTGGGGGSTAKYVQDKGSKNYRRSLYTFWKRTVPPPNMTTFDAPSRDFLHQGVQFRSGKDPVLFLNDPKGLSKASRRKMLDKIAALNQQQFEEYGDPEVQSRIAQYEMAYRMQTSVPDLMDVSKEPDSVYRMYGADSTQPSSFAVNCLLARRLAERGVRFIQLYHMGWDQHFDLPTQIRGQAKDVDQASAALIMDLKQRGMLEDTLVIWSGEFGRTNYSQGILTNTNYGRDHHPRCFTIWMAGGGIKPGLVYGETDEFGYNIVSNPVHVHDFQATVLHQLGIDHEKLTYKYQGRRFRLTDVHGKVIHDLIG